jgi:hypothetical protein
MDLDFRDGSLGALSTAFMATKCVTDPLSVSRFYEDSCRFTIPSLPEQLDPEQVSPSQLGLVFDRFGTT